MAFTEQWAHELKAAHGQFMAHDDAVKANRSDYLPGEPGLIVTEGEDVILNRHRPGDLVPAEGDFGPILRHVEYLFPDPASREHFLNVLAYQLQNPG